MNRILKRLQSIDTHNQALEHAIQETFGSAMDLPAWTTIFESRDPADVNRVMAITGDYAAIVNNLAETLKTAIGSRVTGLLPHRKPHADQTFNAVRDDGGLTPAQAQTLRSLYVLEGRMEHLSPDVTADEVFDGVQLLRAELPGLMANVRSWLASHNIVPKP